MGNIDVISRYNILPDRTYDVITTFVAAILLVVVVYQLYSLIKSRKILQHWADIFERNFIKTGIAIAISARNKDNVLASRHLRSGPIYKGVWGNRSKGN